MNQSSDLAQKLRALSAPFTPSDISWIATAMSVDRSAVHFVPYVPLDVYSRRLGEVLGSFTYAIRFLPESTLGPDGRLLCECLLRIPGIDSPYRGVGEIPAALAHACSRAEAKAFKAACAQFGMGSYLRGLWVAIDHHGNPKCLPEAPDTKLPLNRSDRHHQDQPNLMNVKGAAAAVPVCPRKDNPGVIIERVRKAIGEELYLEVTREVSVEGPASPTRLMKLLRMVEAQIQEAKMIAAQLPDYQFYGVLEDHGIRSLLEVRSRAVLEKVIKDLRKSAAMRAVHR